MRIIVIFCIMERKELVGVDIIIDIVRAHSGIPKRICDRNMCVENEKVF